MLTAAICGLIGLPVYSAQLFWYLAVPLFTTTNSPASLSAVCRLAGLISEQLMTKATGKWHNSDYYALVSCLRYDLALCSNAR